MSASEYSSDSTLEVVGQKESYSRLRAQFSVSGEESETDELRLSRAISSASHLLTIAPSSREILHVVWQGLKKDALCLAPDAAVDGGSASPIGH